jgi:hypothetical protein
MYSCCPQRIAAMRASNAKVFAVRSTEAQFRCARSAVVGETLYKTSAFEGGDDVVASP